MSAGSMTEIWVYLSAQPLVWLTLTLAAYLLAITLHRKAGGHPAANPVPPAQPVHPQATQPITERRTFDVQAEKVEEPTRKDS